VYATIAGLMQSHPRSLLAYAAIVVTSLFVTMLGSGPVQETAFLFILYLGFTLAALALGSVLPNKVNSRLVYRIKLTADSYQACYCLWDMLRRLCCWCCYP